MITVHHLNNSRSQRVLWLLEELGVAYEVKRYERDAKTMLAPPALLAVHPEAAASRAGLNASRPRLTTFLRRIHTRDAYLRALERGGAHSF
jgi:hypothetical protein